MTDLVEIRYGDTPPSMNAKASGWGKHWAQAYRSKKEWQNVFEWLLRASALPARVERVEVSAVLTFTKRRRRDAENYIPLLSKSFGDALVNGRWLVDDTPEHYRFDRVEFALGERAETLLEVAYDLPD
jgi:hypothetical protein